MIHSARQARPTSTFRRTASSTPSFNTSADDFSKKFGFHHLLNSPLPSPALPSIVPRHGKKPAPRLIRRTLRIIYRLTTYICGLLFTYWILSIIFREDGPPASFDPSSIDIGDYTSLQKDNLPQDFTPIVIKEPSKDPRWTVSMLANADFPLKPSQYADLCFKSDQVGKHLHALEGQNHRHGSSYSYYGINPNFIDVEEAERLGHLPGDQRDRHEPSSKSQSDNTRHKALEDGNSLNEGRESSSCKRSMTFVLESTDAGLGKTLMGLWISYGLAKHEGRAFFIEDANWAYGKYGDFFKPPPRQPCDPPPMSHRLPFPHQANHLIISPSTYPWAFGHSFNLAFEQSHGHKSQHYSTTFGFARAGHDALFHLADPDAHYLSSRLSQIESDVRSKGGTTVGLHVRRGDCRPWESQYSDSYIPLSTFINTAQNFIDPTAHSVESAFSPPPPPPS